MWSRKLESPCKCACIGPIPPRGPSCGFFYDDVLPREFERSLIPQDERTESGGGSTVHQPLGPEGKCDYSGLPRHELGTEEVCEQACDCKREHNADTQQPRRAPG